MNIKETIFWGYEQLTPTSESPRVDAELLLAYVLKKSTTFLFTHDKEAVDRYSAFPINLWKFRRLIRKRRRGIPVAYLVGHKEFYGLDFNVNRHVLVPRPDTETLVEAVIEYLHETEGEDDHPRLLIDVGTGSGCIPISILKNVPGLRAVAIDISWAALSVAEANVRKHHLDGRVRLARSNLLGGLDLTEFEGADVILTANLPYLPDKMEVKPELTFEPSIALYSGVDGMDLYKKFVQQLAVLRPKAIFLELYEWQIALLGTQLLGYELKYSKVMSGEARCLMLERK
jgi:release factor glutamine methyltransferase